MSYDLVWLAAGWCMTLSRLFAGLGPLTLPISLQSPSSGFHGSRKPVGHEGRAKLLRAGPGAGPRFFAPPPRAVASNAHRQSMPDGLSVTRSSPFALGSFAARVMIAAKAQRGGQPARGAVLLQARRRGAGAIRVPFRGVATRERFQTFWA